MKMKRITDVFFLVNAVYFVAMAVAHFFGFKYPVLFIYYDVPYYAYQDKIISFSVIAYVLLFIEAYRNPSVRPTAILLLYITSAGLTLVNLSEALDLALEDGQSKTPYWIQTVAIYGITASLHFCHRRTQQTP